MKMPRYHRTAPSRSILSIIVAASMLPASAFAALTANGMQRIGALTLSDATNGGLYSATIDPVNGFAYFGGKNFITKVDIRGNLPVEIGTVSQRAQAAAVIDVAAGYAYFSSGSILYRISLGAGSNPPALVDSLTLSNFIWGAVIDTSDPNVANHYIYCVMTPSPANGNPGTVSKISVASFTEVGSIPLAASETSLRRCAIDTQNGYAYFLGPAASTANPFVVKVALGSGNNPPVRIGAVQLDTVSQGMGSAVIDVANGYAYFGTYFGPNSVPSIVYKVALGAGNAVPSLVGQATLSAGTGAANGLDAADRELCSGVIDAANGYAYFGTDHTYPAKVFQISLGNGGAAPIETGVLQLNGGTHAIGEPNGPNDGENVLNNPSSQYGEVFLQSAVFDSVHGYAYFGTDGYPGMIVKVQLPGTAAGAPSISSGPTANPNPASIGQSVQFSCAVSGGTAPFTWSWSFGDGSPVITGSSVTHAYAAAGSYPVSVTARDGNGQSVSSGLTMSIQAVDGGGGGAPSPDSDLDGVSDADEADAGTNPNDPASVPAISPFTVTRLRGSVNFAKALSDSASLSGNFLDLPAGFNPDGLSLVVNIAGAKAAFVLDKKGRAHNSAGQFSLKLKSKRVAHAAPVFPGGSAQFTVKLAHGNFAAVWSAAGISGDKDVKNQALSMPIKLLFQQTIRQANSQLLYSARAGRSGIFATPRH